MTIRPGTAEPVDPDLAALRTGWGPGLRRIRSVQNRANVVVEVETGCDGYRSSGYLRVFRENGWNAEEIGFELSMLAGAEAIDGTGVTRPIAGTNGNLLQQVPWRGADRHAALFEVAAGTTPCVDPDHAERFGAALAGLHRAFPQPITPPPGRVLDVDRLCRSACAALSRHGSVAGAVAETIAAIRADLLSAEAGWTLSRGFCHGDVCPLNASADAQRITFFDFDECVVAPLALDLASMVVWLRRERNAAAAWAALLRGYDRVRPIGQGERAALPGLVLLSELRIVERLARFSAMPDPSWAVLRDRVAGAVARFRSGRGGLRAVMVAAVPEAV